MRFLGSRTLFSATDLMRFMGCVHATRIDLALLKGEGPEPREDSADAALLRAKGDAHEAEHLVGLWAVYCDIMVIEADWRLRSRDGRGVPMLSVRTCLAPDPMRPTLWLRWRDDPTCRIAEAARGGGHAAEK